MTNYFNNAYQSQMQPGFILVNSEQEARDFPVQPGNTLSFKNRNEPYIYIKAMGFSQYFFEKYKREDEEQPTEPAKEASFGGVKEEIESFREEIDSLKEEIEILKNKRTRRKENDPE